MSARLHSRRLAYDLPWRYRPVMMRTHVSSLLLLAFTAQCAMAQENKVEPNGDELDVTMQIITDPDARKPDEVVRRIELPPRKPAQPAEQNRAGKEGESKGKGNEGKRESQGMGKEMSERAKERAQEAKEEREKARRSEHNEREPGPPRDPPNPPSPRPPRN